MTITYTVSDDNFETVARGVTLKQAARIVGAFPSTLQSCFEHDGVACVGQYVVEPQAVRKPAQRA